MYAKVCRPGRVILPRKDRQTLASTKERASDILSLETETEYGDLQSSDFASMRYDGKRCVECRCETKNHTHGWCIALLLCIAISEASDFYQYTCASPCMRSTLTYVNASMARRPQVNLGLPPFFIVNSSNHIRALQSATEVEI
jgi:hypothetical protein